MIRVAAIALFLLASACATTPPPKPRAVPTLSIPMRPTGLERVLGQDMKALTALFGVADQDVREDGARRLQFAGPFCILDAYLYPPKTGSSDAIVSYVDARQPNGRDIDRAARDVQAAINASLAGDPEKPCRNAPSSRASKSPSSGAASSARATKALFAAALSANLFHGQTARQSSQP